MKNGSLLKKQTACTGRRRHVCLMGKLVVILMMNDFPAAIKLDFMHSYLRSEAENNPHTLGKGK